MFVAQMKYVESLWRWLCNYSTRSLGMGKLHWLWPLEVRFLYLLGVTI